MVLVDKISRRWLRGADEVAAQLHAILAAGWLDQSYRLDGKEQTISTPLSACLKSQQGSWRLISLHAVPLVENHA